SAQSLRGRIALAQTVRGATGEKQGRAPFHGPTMAQSLQPVRYVQTNSEYSEVHDDGASFDWSRSDGERGRTNDAAAHHPTSPRAQGGTPPGDPQRSRCETDRSARGRARRSPRRRGS